MLSHNLREILGDIEQLNTGWTVAVVEALDPAVWHEVFLVSAERVLLNLADDSERALVDALLDSIDVTRTGAVFTAMLGVAPTGGLSSAVALVKASRQHDKSKPKQEVINPYTGIIELRRGQRGLTAPESEYLAQVRAAIMDWIETTKTLTKERDWIQSQNRWRTPEEIFDNLSYVLFSGANDLHIRSARESLLQQDRPDHLASYIAQWMGEAGLDGGVAPARLRALLRGVLLGWRATFRARIGGELKRAFEALHTRIQTRQRALL